jgi:hypothetical protein
VSPKKRVARLQAFKKEARFSGSGAIAVALIITEFARKNGFPIDPAILRTEGGGQVAGLNYGAVHAILRRNGIVREFSKEVGRTNRGNIKNMERYVAFLNDIAAKEAIELDAIEEFWIDQVRLYFEGQPFKLRSDQSKSLTVFVRDLIDQAVKRQKDSTGSMWVGALLQHLVGAKLRCVLGDKALRVEGFSTADQASGRNGDFQIEDTVIHVSATPTEALFLKTRDNLDRGLRPIVVTTAKGAQAADANAETAGVAGRVDVFEISQFVATNIYELGRFSPKGRAQSISDLIEAYNQIIEEVENNQSLKIES